MNFASIHFLVFFTVVYGLYRVLPRGWQNWLLLGASYYFYGAWDWRFLSLILLSTLLDFFLGKAIHASESARQRRRLLSISLLVNLGVLGFFKYFGFFTDSFVTLLSSVGLQLTGERSILFCRLAYRSTPFKR